MAVFRCSRNTRRLFPLQVVPRGTCARLSNLVLVQVRVKNLAKDIDIVFDIERIMVWSLSRYRVRYNNNKKIKVDTIHAHDIVCILKIRYHLLNLRQFHTQAVARGPSWHVRAVVEPDYIFRQELGFSEGYNCVRYDIGLDTTSSSI